MTALIAAGAAAAVLLAFNTTRLSGELSLQDGVFSLHGRFGLIRFLLWPWPKKEKKNGQADKTDKKTQKTPPAPGELLELLQLALRTLGKFIKRLRADVLHIEFIAAGDPYEAAMAYIAAGTAMEALECVAREEIRDLRLTAGTDFQAQATVLSGRIRLSISVFRLAGMGLYFAHGYHGIKRKWKAGGSKNGESTHR